MPSNRITFTTMQTVPDPANPSRVVVSPAAQNLISALINDQSLTTGSGGKSAADTHAASTSTAAPSPAPATIPDAQVTVRVHNASGLAGRASTIAQYLINQGYSPNGGPAKAPAPASTTSVHYPPGAR